MSELLSQGGFGCIFYPGITCSGKTKEDIDSVSKLETIDFNSTNEINIGSIIKTIPNYNLFFLPVISACSISLGNIDKNLIDQCKIIKSNIEEYHLLELPYLKNISFMKLFSDSSRTNRHHFLTFIETYQYITMSIGALIEKDIIHFDIKEENILYSIKFENPILIDFGLSIPIKELNSTTFSKYFYTYSPHYYLWPLEVHVINYLLYKGDLTTDSIKNIVEEYISTNAGLINFSKEFKDSYANSGINFLNQYIKMEKMAVISEIIKFGNTWDLYALSIMYLNFIKLLFKDGFVNSPLIIAFSKILVQNIHPDPSKRLSVTDTRKKYYDIFYINDKPSDYLTLIESLNYKNLSIK